VVRKYQLDFLLRQKGTTHVIVVGLLANTCIESTARFGMELGYHVTLVRDATAAFSHEMMHAAHELNGPTYAHSSARGTTGAPLPAISCLGAFRTPAAAVRG
jgi:nicotinamidase-related amidase